MPTIITRGAASIRSFGFGGNSATVPCAPSIGTAVATSSSTANVSFTAGPNGGSPITSFQAISSPGCFVGTGTTSPIAVGCLSAATAYTFKVRAQNAIGYSAYSASSNSVTTPAASNSQTFSSPGTYSWTAPAGVTSVSVVAVGSGGPNTVLGYLCQKYNAAGGGAGLGYRNNISVNPGCTYTVVVGAVSCNQYGFGADSYFISRCVVKGGGGGGGYHGGSGGTYYGDGGGNGGNGGSGGCSAGSGGGGAGGYAGCGGYGGTNGRGSSGTGGAGGGGYGGNTYASGNTLGGGVGLLGQGASGSYGCHANGNPGSGGSGVTYGGGGNGIGAVRIVWPGNTRTFPSTNVGLP